ncbi:hypothetical protein VNO78_02079 [Psophocarpus tetragonolobus]|uniref:Uncharacterized protein n=1 Tax=Psophocarpus tetragonolobus TaxID=3891 RepID=A0AAN9XUY9_PSOTE
MVAEATMRLVEDQSATSMFIGEDASRGRKGVQIEVEHLMDVVELDVKKVGDANKSSIKSPFLEVLGPTLVELKNKMRQDMDCLTTEGEGEGDKGEDSLANDQGRRFKIGGEEMDVLKAKVASFEVVKSIPTTLALSKANWGVGEHPKNVGTFISILLCA